MTGHDLPLHISGRGRTGFARNVSQLCETRRIRERRISRPMYGKPSTWPSRLSLSPSLLEDPPYPRDVSRCQGACIYRRERTVGDAAHPTCCSSPSNSFQASIPPRKSTPAEIYEQVETLVGYKNGARDREIRLFLSLSLPSTKLCFFSLEPVNYYLSNDRIMEEE